MSNKPTDTATVRATYSTAATFMQTPSPSRVEKFDKWLDEVKAQAWDEGYIAGADPHCGSQALNPYRKGN